MSRLPVEIHSIPHPFRVEAKHAEVMAGLTLAEMLELVQPDAVLRQHAFMFIGDVAVDRSLWRLVKPKPGAFVSIRVVPTGGGGGDKNPLRTILTLAVVAATFYFAGPLGAGLAGSIGITSAAGIAAITAGVQAGLLVGGTFLVDAIAPIRPPTLGPDGGDGRASESPSYYIDNVRNSVRLYQPITIILGRHRVIPPLAAVPFTESLGDTNRMRMLFCWGFGPLMIEELKIDETPIGDFVDIEIETVQGFQTDQLPSLYTQDIDQQNFSIVLTEANTWQSRTTGQEADEISVDIVLPRGLASHNMMSGDREEHTVIVQIQFRQQGTTQWQTPGLRAAVSEGITIAPDAQVTIRDSRTRPKRLGFRWSTPSRARYDVRVQRVSPDETEDRVISDTAWSALRSILDEPPINPPASLALTAIDALATDQFNSFVDQLSAICTTICPDWNAPTNAWITRPTSNPASLYRYLLQHPGNAEQASDSQIDLAALQTWHEFCDMNDFECNGTVDTRRGIIDILADIAATGRASPSRIDGKWTVIVDTGTQTPVQHYSPRNTSGISMARDFEPVPHGLRIQFNNRDVGWRRDERIVYRDGFDDSNSTRYTNIEGKWITDSDAIYVFGRFHLAQLLLRRELWSVESNLEHLVAGRGSLVTLSHEAIAVSLGSARISGLELLAGEITGIVLDAPVILKAAAAHSVQVRTVDNQKLVFSITNQGPGEAKTLALTVPISSGDQPSIGDLVSVGETDAVSVDALVTRVESQEDFGGRVSLIPFQPGVYQAHLGPIPPYNTGIGGAVTLLDTLLMTILGVREDSIIDLSSDRQFIQVIVLEVQPVGEIGATMEVRVSPGRGWLVSSGQHPFAVANRGCHWRPLPSTPV